MYMSLSLYIYLYIYRYIDDLIDGREHCLVDFKSNGYYYCCLMNFHSSFQRVCKGARARRESPRVPKTAPSAADRARVERLSRMDMQSRWVIIEEIALCIRQCSEHYFFVYVFILCIVNLCLRACVPGCVCVCVCTYVCLYVCVYACLYHCLYYTCVCMHRYVSARSESLLKSGRGWKIGDLSSNCGGSRW